MKIKTIGGKIAQHYLVLTPAYGRCPKSRTDAVKSFDSGEDWVLQPKGEYCSVRDFKSGIKVQLRFGKDNYHTTMATVK